MRGKIAGLVLGVCLVVPLGQAQAQSLPSLEAGMRPVETAEQKAEKARSAARAQAARAQAAREKAAKENAAREQAARQAEARRQAEREQAAAAKRQADQEAARLASNNAKQAFHDTLKDGSAGPEMVVIPAGSFMMGSPPSEEGRSDDEGPQHRVSVSRFAMGKYEVTFAEYDGFARATNRELPGDRGWGRGNHPVINVSWEDAQAYAKWLSEQTGQTYRLPSEAEWEYAARAGTTGPFSFSGPISPDRVNYDSSYSYGNSRKDSSGYRAKTVEVGSLPANAWGLYEVHGNVWEWVEDCWHDNYNTAPTDGSAWTSSCDAGRRVLRGGSWDNSPWWVRSANRFGNTPTDRGYFLGFRLARTF